VQRSEFNKEMQQLEVIYFSGRSETQLRKLGEAWYRTFADVDVRDFAKAIEQYKSSQDGQKEPRPAAIYWLANEARQYRMIEQCPMMTVKFGPLEHECCPNVEQARKAIAAYKEAQSALGEVRQKVSTLAKVSEPRALLAFVEPDAYEAIHVECTADKCRCPFCGHEFTKLVNPLVVWLAHKYPKQTKNWIPYFKGMVVCDSCNAALKNGARIATDSKPVRVGKPCPIVGRPSKEVRDYKAEAAGDHESRGWTNE
jgi:hypothetical protein